MADEHEGNEATGPMRWIPWLVGVAVLIWLAAMCGKDGHPPPPQASVPAPAPTPAPTPAPAPAPEPVAAAPAPALPPAAKVYFAPGAAGVPKETPDTLKDIVAYLKTDAASKAVISGFHDPTGNKAQNEELAKNRAKAVRDALKAAGIAEDRAVMQKPQETTGTGNDAEARRVEVSIQQ